MLFSLRGTKLLHLFFFLFFCFSVFFFFCCFYFFSLLKLLVSLGSMIGRERSSRLIAFVSSLLSSSFFFSLSLFSLQKIGNQLFYVFYVSFSFFFSLSPPFRPAPRPVCFFFFFFVRKVCCVVTQGFDYSRENGSNSSDRSHRTADKRCNFDCGFFQLFIFDLYIAGPTNIEIEIDRSISEMDERTRENGCWVVCSVCVPLHTKMIRAVVQGEAECFWQGQDQSLWKNFAATWHSVDAWR